MTDTGDPRRQAFQRVPARPELKALGEEVPQARKLEVGPPPPKRPAVVVSDPEPTDQQLPAAVPEDKASTPESPSRRQPRAEKTSNRAEEPNAAFDPKAYGVKKGQKIWVTTMLPKALSSRVDETVASTDRSLGALVIDAVRSQHQRIAEELAPPAHDPNDPFPAVSPSLGHYQERGGSIRRDIGIHPGEAEALAALAHKLGTTPSALMRRAIELTLG